MELDERGEALLAAELCTALLAGGLAVADVQVSWALTDGGDAAEGLGLAPTVKEANLYVDRGTEDGTARAVLGFACAWFRARRRHRPDDVEFVSVRSTDVERPLVRAQIGRGS